jgi:hypothetical protein
MPKMAGLRRHFAPGMIVAEFNDVKQLQATF